MNINPSRSYASMKFNKVILMVRWIRGILISVSKSELTFCRAFSAFNSIQIYALACSFRPARRRTSYLFPFWHSCRRSCRFPSCGGGTSRSRICSRQGWGSRKRTCMRRINRCPSKHSWNGRMQRFKKIVEQTSLY